MASWGLQLRVTQSEREQYKKAGITCTPWPVLADVTNQAGTHPQFRTNWVRPSGSGNFGSLGRSDLFSIKMQGMGCPLGVWHLESWQVGHSDFQKAEEKTVQASPNLFSTSPVLGASWRCSCRTPRKLRPPLYSRPWSCCKSAPNAKCKKKVDFFGEIGKVCSAPLPVRQYPKVAVESQFRHSGESVWAEMHTVSQHLVRAVHSIFATITWKSTPKVALYWLRSLKKLWTYRRTRADFPVLTSPTTMTWKIAFEAGYRVPGPGLDRAILPCTACCVARSGGRTRVGRPAWIRRVDWRAQRLGAGSRQPRATQTRNA